MRRTTHTEVASSLDIYGYEAMLKYFDKFPDNAEKHTDYYFADKEGILERNNIILRQRKKKDDKLQDDFKIPTKQNPQEVIDLRESTTQVIGLFSKEIQQSIEMLGIREIDYVGFVTTKRISIPCSSVDGKWVIDHSIFPLGKEEYRIELKHGKNFCTKAKDIFETTIQRVNLPLVIPPSKFKILRECLLEDEKVKRELKEGVGKILKAP